jgi:WhiB family redox-sensing transcriptional regulator
VSGVDDRAWLADAACAGYPADWWFPEERSPDPIHMGLVRSVCSSCPVRRECLDYALVADHVGARGGHGIWAGLSEGQRVSMRTTICPHCRRCEDPALLWDRVSHKRHTGACGACDALRARRRELANAREREKYREAHPEPAAAPPLPEVLAADAEWWSRQVAAIKR